MALGTVPNPAFAALIGVSPSMASRLLNGERLPSLDTIVRISEACDRPLAEVVAARNEGHTECGLYLRRLAQDALPQQEPEDAA